MWDIIKAPTRYEIHIILTIPIIIGQLIRLSCSKQHEHLFIIKKYV